MKLSEKIFLFLFCTAVAAPRGAMGQQPHEPSLWSSYTESIQWQQDPLLAELSHANLSKFQAVPLDQIEGPVLRMAFDELAEVHDLVPRSAAAVAFVAQGSSNAWLVELVSAVSTDARLFLYYLPDSESLYFLRAEGRDDAGQSIRIWGSGSSEIVMERSGIALVGGPSGMTFRLRSPSLSKSEKVSDTIACLGRQLGLTPTPTALGDLLARSACGATNLLSLALTTYNCLSFPHPIATIGCVVGVGKLVSCSFANCSSPTGSATVEWTITDGCPDSRGMSVRFFDRTRGGFYPPGSSYTISSGSSRKIKFTAPRGSQLCFGAQASPATSSYWCVGLDGTQDPNYPGAGTSLCCATVPSSGSFTKSNRLTCG